jgi:hypothetical protein
MGTAAASQPKQMRVKVRTEVKQVLQLNADGPDRIEYYIGTLGAVQSGRLEVTVRFDPNGLVLVEAPPAKFQSFASLADDILQSAVHTEDEIRATLMDIQKVDLV